MKTSKQGFEMLCGFESFRARPYNDGNPGNATVGYGHLIAHRPVNASDARGVWIKSQRTPGQLTEKEARTLLKQRLEREFEPAVQRMANVAPLNPNQWDATVLFTYNLGVGILENSHDFGRLLRQRKYQAAADSMLEYVNPGSQWEQGLRKRRAKERALFLKPALSPEQLLVKGWRDRLKRVRARAEERRAKGLVAWPPGLRALANRLKTNIRAHTH
jgi:GH24 family phage-related lysozyme (muramidase)